MSWSERSSIMRSRKHASWVAPRWDVDVPAAFRRAGMKILLCSPFDPHRGEATARRWMSELEDGRRGAEQQGPPAITHVFKAQAKNAPVTASATVKGCR